MLCVHIFRLADGYTIIRLTDHEGIFCSYAGYDGWPEHRLLDEQGIRL